ncbi:MAG: hypothetical protein GY788_16360 [bacterium]|nr:hypothetical protein [bacterium]
MGVGVAAHVAVIGELPPKSPGSKNSWPTDLTSEFGDDPNHYVDAKSRKN